jgi:hypothetical protein
LRHLFIVAQIALGFVLLAEAGLLGLSLKRAMEISPGFQPAHTLAAQISLVGNRYPSPDAGLVFVDRLTRQLEQQPGVSAVGVANNIPFSGYNGKSAAVAEGHVLRAGESARGYYSYGVSGNYFHAMGFSLLRGRFLTAEDSHRKARTCVVDEDFARYNWPATNPLGKRLFQGSRPGSVAEAFTVVGIVGRIKQAGLTDDTAQGAVYYPYIYRPDSNIFVSGIFSGIALVLIAVGTYGVLTYAVAQRRREIAVRMTLGARPEEIQRQFFSIVLRLLAGGGVVGLFGAWATGRAMQAVLFHVPAHSSAILAGSAGTISVVALAACLLPAYRAARVSPMQALADQ